MVTFSVPSKTCEKGFFEFSIEGGSVLFAGSRYLTIPHYTCTLLINAFGSLGLCFMTGCARGVDESFRKALAASEYVDQALVACAFCDRVDKIKGIYSVYVVPDGLKPKVALAKRTVWMTSRSSLLVLFPTDPIGKGSKLAFKSAIFNSKPVFIVSGTPPRESSLYSIYPSTLFGVVSGFWCIPPVYQKTGLCQEST